MLQIVATLFLINFGADGFVWMENLDDWKSSCQVIIDKLQQEPIISGMHDNSSPNEINNLKESLRTLEAKVSKVMELIRTEPRAVALLSDLPKMDAVLRETGVNTGQNVATDAETTAAQVQATNDADKENIFRTVKSDENGAAAATRIRRRHSTEDVRRIRAKPLISSAEMVLEAKEEVFAKELTAKIEAIADTPVKGNEFMALVDKFNWEWTELFDRRIDQWLKTDQEKEKHRIKMVETSMTAYEISKPLKSTIISQLEELNSQTKTEIQSLDEELHKLSRQRIQIAERAKDTLAKFSLDLQTNIGLPQRVVNAKIQPVGDMLSKGSDSGALSYYEIENVIYAAKMKVQSAFQIPESAYQWSIFVDASEQAEPSQMTADDKGSKPAKK
uniref:SUN domain-containing protein n=1 Tax=Globodera pallida TaxID=36090 RepID=A0A183CA52_GLOPA